LLGDVTYGGRAIAGFERQALHAWRLSLLHPVTSRRLTVDCPLPEDLLRLGGQIGLPLEGLAVPSLSESGA
jgi:23S rRNA pseudouridine1911/1915/1917 synthase